MDIDRERVVGINIGIAGLGLFFCIVQLMVLNYHVALEKLANMVPLETEQVIAEKLFENIKPQLQLAERDVQNAFSKLTAHLIDKDDNPYNIQVFVSQSEDVNAFAFLGGYIVVNKGLINAATTPEEVLGVLSHEMAHVEKRHALKAMIQRLGVSALLAFITGNVEGIASVVIGQSELLFSRSFSRSQESQADARAVEILTSNKVSPHGLLAFFSKMDNKESEELSGFKVYSTHPTSKDRVKAIEDMIEQKKRNDYRKVNFTLDALKQKLSSPKKIKDKKSE